MVRLNTDHRWIYNSAYSICISNMLNYFERHPHVNHFSVFYRFESSHNV